MKQRPEIWDIRDKAQVTIPSSEIIKAIGFQSAVSAMPPLDRERYMRAVETANMVVAFGQLYSERNSR